MSNVLVNICVFDGLATNYGHKQPGAQQPPMQPRVVQCEVATSPSNGLSFETGHKYIHRLIGLHPHKDRD